MLKVIFKELNIVGSRVYSFDHFRKTVDMLEKIIKNELFDLEKLISEIYQIEDLEKAIKVMQKGKNLGKILIEC